MTPEDNQGTTTPSDSGLRDQLYAQAEASDRGEAPSPLDTSSSANQDGEGAEQGTEARAAEPSVKNNDKPDNPESSAEQTDDQGRKRGPDGKFLPKEEATSEKPTETGKPSTEPSKYQKERQRLDQSWKQVDTEKAEVREERARLARLAEDVEQLKRGASQPQQRNDGPNLSSQEYATAAHTFYQKGLKLVKDGDTDAAQEQFDLAAQAQGEANRRAASEYEQHQTQSLQERAGKWRATAEAVIKEVPEYGDGTSERSQAMQQLLKDHPLLGEHEHGFRYAHEILDLRQSAAEASGLREENTKLKAEIERLNEATSLHGGKPSKAGSKGKSLNEMSIDELRAQCQRDAELQDAA